MGTHYVKEHGEACARVYYGSYPHPAEGPAYHVDIKPTSPPPQSEFKRPASPQSIYLSRRGDPDVDYARIHKTTLHGERVNCRTGCGLGIICWYHLTDYREDNRCMECDLGVPCRYHCYKCQGAKQGGKPCYVHHSPPQSEIKRPTSPQSLDPIKTNKRALEYFRRYKECYKCMNDLPCLDHTINAKAFLQCEFCSPEMRCFHHS